MLLHMKHDKVSRDREEKVKGRMMETTAKVFFLIIILMFEILHFIQIKWGHYNTNLKYIHRYFVKRLE